MEGRRGGVRKIACWGWTALPTCANSCMGVVRDGQFSLAAYSTSPFFGGAGGDWWRGPGHK